EGCQRFSVFVPLKVGEPPLVGGGGRIRRTHRIVPPKDGPHSIAARAGTHADVPPNPTVPARCVVGRLAGGSADRGDFAWTKGFRACPIDVQHGIAAWTLIHATSVQETRQTSRSRLQVVEVGLRAMNPPRFKCALYGIAAFAVMAALAVTLTMTAG